MKLFQSLFQQHPEGLVCPRCEKSLAAHDDKACERRMSRRFFIGMSSAAVVALAAGLDLVTVVEAKADALVVTATPRVVIADWKDCIVVRSRGSVRVNIKGAAQLPSGETEIRLPGRMIADNEWTSLTSQTITPRELEEIVE